MSPKSSWDGLLPQPTNHTPLLTLVWLKDNCHQQDARKLVENMLRHSCGPYGLTAIRGGDAQLAWGMLLPEKFGPLTCWSIYVNGFEVCLVEGDMYDDPPTLKLVPGDNPRLAREVAAQMQQCPDQRLIDLNGIYSGVYVNSHRSCAYVFGDLTGNRPIFWLSDKDRFVVTGNLWAFRGCDGFDRQWDSMALMEMLTLGIPLAGRTWIAGVKLLQRGRQVRSFADGQTKVHMLLKPVVRQSWSFKQSVRALRDSLDETTGRICRRLDRPVGLALSGGLDSRTLLASLHTQSIDHRNFTFLAGPEEVVDGDIARAAANLLGERHEAVALDSAVANALQRDCRLMNEGNSQGFGFLLLAAHVQKNTNALLIGHEEVRETADTFNPLWVRSKHELANRMLRGYMTKFTSEQAYKVLAQPYRVSWKDILSEWFDSFEQIDQQSIMDVYLEHVADHRVQRRTRPRIDIARWFCLPVYPYMDARLYTTYYSLPLAHLHAERAPLALLRNYKTGLENLPAAARHFGMPIYKEYRYRHILHLGRVMKEKLVLPLKTKWQESRGAWGHGKSPLYSHWGPDLQKVGHCPLFDWHQAQKLIEEGRSGTFVNRSAIGCMIDAIVIDEFLFGSGLSGDRALRFLQPIREIHFVRTTTNHSICSGSLA